MATEMSRDEYSRLLLEIRHTVEVFAGAEKFSTDNEGNIYVWGEFSELESRTLCQAISNIHPNARLTINPLFETGPDYNPD